MRGARASLGSSRLPLRSDEQLAALFRAGDEEAFRVIHDRYRRQLLAYVDRILVSRSDAEDVLQDVFARASQSLRLRPPIISLRAWLYRVARNACIDELRRHAPVVSEIEIAFLERVSDADPVAEAEQREFIRRLVVDLGRLPDQQRSALLMRELEGLSYSQVAATLGTSVPAVKSLLVRARARLTESLEARETSCSQIRQHIDEASARGARPPAVASRHLRDCACCQRYRGEISRGRGALGALAPPVGLLASLVMRVRIATGGRRAGGAVSAGASTGTAAMTASAGGLGAGAAHLVAVAMLTAIAAVGGAELHSAAPGSRGGGSNPPAEAAGAVSSPAGLRPAQAAGYARLHAATSSGASRAGTGASDAAYPARGASSTSPLTAGMLPLGTGFSRAHVQSVRQSSVPLGAGHGSVLTCSAARQPTGPPACAGAHSAEPTGAPPGYGQVSATSSTPLDATSDTPTGAGGAPGTGTSSESTSPTGGQASGSQTSLAPAGASPAQGSGSAAPAAGAQQSGSAQGAAGAPPSSSSSSPSESSPSSTTAGLSGSSTVAGLSGSSTVAGLSGSSTVAGLSGSSTVAGLSGSSAAGFSGASADAGTPAFP